MHTHFGFDTLCVHRTHKYQQNYKMKLYFFLNAFTTQRLQQYFFRVFHFSFVFRIAKLALQGRFIYEMEIRFNNKARVVEISDRTDFIN